MTMTPVKRALKSGVVTGKVPAVAGVIFFPARVASNGQHRDDHHKAAEEHRDC